MSRKSINRVCFLEVRNVNGNTYTFASFVKNVYLHMSLGLLISAVTSLFVSQSINMMYKIFGTNLFWVFLFLPLCLTFFIANMIDRLSTFAARLWFFVLAAAEGVSLAPIFHIYTGQSICYVFAISSLLFLGMAVYGHFTNRDLTSIGALCFFGLLGLIAVSILNIFFMNSLLFFISSIVGVIVFLGFIAYDSNSLKLVYSVCPDPSKYSIVGALSLYLNFINLFLDLLRLFGKRK